MIQSGNAAEDDYHLVLQDHLIEQIKIRLCTRAFLAAQRFHGNFLKHERAERLELVDRVLQLRRIDPHLSARKVEKTEPKILIPVTEDSGGRASGLAAHPLCDYLKYVAPTNEKAHDLYLQTLRAWLDSPHSHPFLQAVFGIL